MNDEAVYRTAPATPGLLNSIASILIVVVQLDYPHLRAKVGVLGQFCLALQMEQWVNVNINVNVNMILICHKPGSGTRSTLCLFL